MAETKESPKENNTEKEKETVKNTEKKEGNDRFNGKSGLIGDVFRHLIPFNFRDK